MSNITEDLRRYKELKPFFDKSLRREKQEALGEPFDEDSPDWDFSMMEEFYDIKESICQIAVMSPSLVIEDRELHQIFGDIRKSAITHALNEFGGVVSDDLFEALMSRYDPKFYVQRLIAT